MFFTYFSFFSPTTRMQDDQCIHGLQDAQQAQLTKDISNGIEMAFGFVQKKIRGSSPPSDIKIMVASQLLELSKARVTQRHLLILQRNNQL